MRHSFGKHHVVEHEDQGLIRPKSGTGVQDYEAGFSISRTSTFRFPEKSRELPSELQYGTGERGREKLIT